MAALCCARRTLFSGREDCFLLRHFRLWLLLSHFYATARAVRVVQALCLSLPRQTTSDFDVKYQKLETDHPPFCRRDKDKTSRTRFVAIVVHWSIRATIAKQFMKMHSMSKETKVSEKSAPDLVLQRHLMRILRVFNSSLSLDISFEKYNDDQ